MTDEHREACSCCGQDNEEVRPYGFQGAPLCWDCCLLDDMMPQASLSLTFQLLACGENALLGKYGPVPFPDDIRRWN